MVPAGASRNPWSPEQLTTSLPQESAGVGRRLAAMAYDALLLGGLIFSLTLVLILMRRGEAIPPGSLWFEALLVLASFVFFGWFWTHGGQTLGMRAWKLRVERDDGRTLGWLDALRRYLAAWVLLLPPGLGLAWAWLDADRRCWHDRLSRTRVVRLAPPA